MEHSLLLQLLRGLHVTVVLIRSKPRASRKNTILVRRLLSEDGPNSVWLAEAPTTVCSDTDDRCT